MLLITAFSLPPAPPGADYSRSQARLFVSPDRLRLNAILLALALTAIPAKIALAADEIPFSDPIALTSDMPAAGYKMSRNSSRQMALDSSGTLHLTFFSGQSQANPQTPSNVYYRAWTPGAGASAAIKVDNSIADSTQQPIGGRHPNLHLASDGTVWVAWHDYRHCAGGIGSWIDNIEIYADRMSPGGAFADTDIRLTDTNAAHLGDNGFSARLASRADGTLGLLWYDFSLDYELSDIFYRESGPGGVFGAPPAMGGLRLTDVGDREPPTAFTLPDMAVDSSDTVHLIWVAGTTMSGDLHYGRLTTAGVLLEETLLSQGVTAFFEPPRIFHSPSGSEIWVAWADNPFGSSNIHLRRRAAGADWDSEVTLSMSGSQRQVDGAVGRDGRLHLTYVDDGIRYARYNPTSGQVEHSERVAEASLTDRYPRPSIHVGAAGAVFIMWALDTLTGGDTDVGEIHIVWKPAPEPPRPVVELRGPVWAVY